MFKHCSLLLMLMIVSIDVPRDTRAADKPDPALDDSFEKNIRPLLSEHCFKCHGDQKPKAGLRLNSRATILQGGESGPAAVPGKPGSSLLLKAVRHENGLEMPPKQKLKSQQIDLLARWIKDGLPWPEPSSEKAVTASGATELGHSFTEEQRRFWSFQPVRRVAPPTVQDSAWPRSELDQFILAALEKRGLWPARQADKRTLIRRASYDLIGLPPTEAEIRAFLADQAPDAFARVVDRLLSSPHYGERWGRHWLDVVRYTDCFDARILTGAGTIMDIGEAYRYRDWVVNAFNRDLPYDQFIIQQIAGDLLPATSPAGVNVDGIVATGMLAIGNWGGGDADKEKLLTDIVDDQIDVVSRSFLGLTLACARCHDHKFDPLTTEDYYALAGIFFSTHILRDPGPKTDGPPMLRIPLLPRAEVERRDRHQARIAEIKGLIKCRSAQPQTTESRDQIARLNAELGVLTPMPAIEYANGAQEGGCPLSAQVGFHDARVHIRGRYDRLGPLVPRRFPSILAGDKQEPITQGSGRLQLAKWVASPANPLTARVMVNRIWQYHFGEGLVPTPGNLGKLGARPTHPELLDYLSDEFVKTGWSIKAVHRRLMLSAAYQQDSVPRAETLQGDPDNRLFGFVRRRRLEAEEIRDSLLSFSGRLDPKMGGRASQDFNLPRRTLYLMTIRSDRATFRELFDASDPTAITDKRIASTVAPQALFLMNNPFITAQTNTLAGRILRESPAGEVGKIKRVYELLFGRLSRPEEVSVGQSLLAQIREARSHLAKEKTEQFAWEEYCQVLICANEFIYID
jgi:hypothetical protein